MILAGTLALTVAGGLLLRGCWDIWAASLIHLATVAGLTLWAMSRVALGFVPVPSKRTLVWTAALLGLGALSVHSSPVGALASPAWYAFLNALWIFPAITALSKDERFYVDEAIRAAAWVLMILAFYQRWVLGDARPASALVNANVYAGTILLLLPLSLEKRDWLLAAGLLVNLWWVRSVGAWLGLFAAILTVVPWRSGLRLWTGLAGSLLCLILIYDKFQSPDVLNRLDWWKHAAAMIADRPLLGFGPGAFAHVLPGYRSQGGMGSLYAHQYILETASGFGVPFTLVWLAGLWRCLLTGRSYKRFGAIAIFIHSLWDWPLSMPANLWMFAYFTASSLSEGWAGVNIRSRWRVPAAVLVAAAGTLVWARSWDLWAADRAKSRMQAHFAAGRLEPAAAEGRTALSFRPDDPETHLVLAGIAIREARPGALDEAVELLEEAARLNPYRPGTWLELSSALARLGREDEAASALERGAAHCVRLRGPR